MKNKTKIIEIKFKKGKELSHETLSFFANKFFEEVAEEIWIKDKLPKESKR